MEMGALIPVAVFAMVALIVAIQELVKIRELEIQTEQRIHEELLDHQRKMLELNHELERVCQSR